MISAPGASLMSIQPYDLHPTIREWDNRNRGNSKASFVELRVLVRPGFIVQRLCHVIHSALLHRRRRRHLGLRAQRPRSPDGQPPTRPPARTKAHGLKRRYTEYTDSTFTTQKPQPEWLGILARSFVRSRRRDRRRISESRPSRSTTFIRMGCATTRTMKDLSYLPCPLDGRSRRHGTAIHVSLVCRSASGPGSWTAEGR